jgi:hypothetical protein
MEYIPKFKLNQQVYYQDKGYFIRGMQTKECSHPNPEIVYSLSVNESRPCTSNVTTLSLIEENSILSILEHKNIKIKEAIDLLAREGIASIKYKPLIY